MRTVYKCYNEKGVALYIGSTLCVDNRLSQHKRTSPWFVMVKTITLDHYESKRKGYAKELESIALERPQFNKNGFDFPATEEKEDDLVIDVKRFEAFNALLVASNIRKKEINELRKSGMTWREIGLEFGITRQRAQQIGGKQ